MIDFVDTSIRRYVVDRYISSTQCTHTRTSISLEYPQDCILHSMMYVTGAVCMYVLHILHSMVYVTGAVCLYVQKEGHSMVWCRAVRREELFPRCPHSKCVFTYVVDNKGGDGGMCTCCVFIWINGLSNGGTYGKVPLLSLSSRVLGRCLVLFFGSSEQQLQLEGKTMQRLKTDRPVCRQC